MARKPHNSPEATDGWEVFMPPLQTVAEQPHPDLEYGVESALSHDDVAPAPSAIPMTSEVYDYLQRKNAERQAAIDERIRRRAAVLAAQQQSFRVPSMFGGQGLPAAPLGGQMVSTAKPGYDPFAPGVTTYGRGGLPPVPDARDTLPAGKNLPANPKKSPAEWFKGLSKPQKIMSAVVAGGLAVGGLVLLPKSSQSGEATAAQLSQEYPAYDNNNISCSAAIAKVAFAGGMTVQLNLHLKEPGHTAYFPATAYLGTDLSVAGCGVPSSKGGAQHLAEYQSDRYVVNRAALNLTVAPIENAFANQVQNCNDLSLLKRICINLPKGFIVDGKTATIADTETRKGSNLFAVTTADGKKYSVSGGEIARVNALITGPAKGAKPSAEYKQYLNAIVTSMKFVATEAIENPALCTPSLQDAVDQVIKNAILARSNFNGKQPDAPTSFNSSHYGSMSRDFMNQAANKTVLDPTSKNHILDITGFNPTCSASPIEAKQSTKL